MTSTSAPMTERPRGVIVPPRRALRRHPTSRRWAARLNRWTRGAPGARRDEGLIDRRGGDEPRAILTDRPARTGCGAPVAPGLERPPLGLAARLAPPRSRC